jgi:zinc/manganese transport system permease protein
VTPTSLDLSIVGPAFLTGLVVLATHVPLGQRVLERGIVFLDLAVAQLAVTGAVAVHLLGIENRWVVQGAALGAALLGAWGLHRCERRWPEIQEALIGATFVVAASVVVLLLASAPHGGEHLQDVLAGQILWVTWDEIGVAAAASAAVLTLWWTLPNRLAGGLFYALFAVAVTVSVQLVGVYLVFASLILPALVARRLGLAVGYLAGTAGYALGLAASVLLDLPAGPSAVCGLAVTSAAFASRRVRA